MPLLKTLLGILTAFRMSPTCSDAPAHSAPRLLGSSHAGLRAAPSEAVLFPQAPSLLLSVWHQSPPPRTLQDGHTAST